jgi:DNA-binding response OmpR family regulator
MHILIVEDEVGIVQFLQQGLEEEGYQVTSAFDLQGFELTKASF